MCVHTYKLFVCVKQLAPEVLCHLPHSLMCVFAVGKCLRRYSLERQSACCRGEGRRWWREAERVRAEMKQERARGRDSTFNSLFSGSQQCEQQRLYTPNTFFMSLKLKLSALILTSHRTNWKLLFAAKPDKQHKSRWHSQHMVQMFLKQRCIVASSYVSVLLRQSRH